MKKLATFNPTYPLPKNFKEEDCYLFEVDCLKSKTWDSDPDTLFIIEHVDSGDIKQGQLLVTSPAKDVFDTVLEDAQAFYRMITGRTPKQPNMAVINFNYHRNYHLKGVEYEVSLSEATTRCHRLINKLKPKTIVVFGKTAAGWLLDKTWSDKGIHFGMVKDLDTGKHQCKLIPLPTYHNTIMRIDEDASEDDYDKAIAHANLIGFISRMMSSMYDHKMLLSYNLKPKYRVLSTYKEVDEYLTELEGRDQPIALDIETNGLFNYGLKLSTLQLATSANVGVIIPVQHKSSPFIKDKELLQKVMRRIRDFVAFKTPKTYWIGHNLAYDLRALRQILKLTNIRWGIWDTMAGEHALDENLVKLDSRMVGESRPRNFALDKTALRYGMDWYTTADFGKSQRHLIHEVELTDEVLKYCSVDVQAAFAIHHLQHTWASRLTNPDGTSYLDTYHNYVLHVVGNCASHTISVMEQRGIQISRKEFAHLMSEDSKLIEKIEQLEEEFYKLPNVAIANRRLLDKMGAPKTGLFGAVNDWVFNIRKEAHIQLLFLKVLKIKDYSVGKSGKASVGKAFQAKHGAAHKEVELYGEYKKYNAIMSTYIKGWSEKMDENPDSVKDYRIRPSYSYLLATGRSNSFGPNLQNVAEHHVSAYFIKYTMQAPLGYIKMDADYSSHEVRVWGIASGDKVLAKTFAMALKCIYDLRINSDEESYLVFKYESDTHKINYSNFTGVPVREVTKEQRQAAKGIVFGSLYGIGDYSLAASINRTLEETREIKAKFFKKYASGAKWMKLQCQQTIDHQFVTSLLGRRRNLIGHKIPVPTLQAAFQRRAQNSPIQGCASDMGYIAARLYTLALEDINTRFEIPTNKQYMTEKGWEEHMTKFDTNPSFMPVGIDSMVHDSIKSQVRYDMYYIAIYLKEWAMTTGVRAYVKKYLGVTFNVDLGVEFDVGPSAASMKTWGWVAKDLTVHEDGKDPEVIKCLETLFKETLDEQVAYGYPINVKELMREAKTRYKEAEKYLLKTYPLPLHKYINHGVIN